MRKKIIYYFLGLFIASVLGLFFYLFYWDMPDLSPQLISRKIVCQKTEESYFLKRVSKGLNNSSIILSVNNTNSYNEKIDFLFNADKIFYKFIEDTLLIKSGSFSKNPIRFTQKVSIKIEQITENLDYINFEKNYLTNGYSKFPN